MKKVTIKSLKFSKETISSLDAATIKGGTMGSGMCTSSVNPNNCKLACATGIFVGC